MFLARTPHGHRSPAAIAGDLNAAAREGPAATVEGSAVWQTRVGETMTARRCFVANVRVLGLVCLMTLALAGARAWSAEAPEDAAQAAAASWLELVDEGQYGESWEQAARLFKRAVTVDQWKQALAGVRGPLGKRVSRKIKSRQYMEKVPGGPDGKYVVLQFETVFEEKASAIETVTPMVDPDGIWRVSGYYIK